ncbi:MAG: TonB-dependent receptor domain-containing protein, partial [Flavobacteriales bacterium]
MGYNFGFQYKKSNRFYDNGTTGRYTLTGNEDVKNELDVQRSLQDSRGTESVYTSALLNMSYKLNNTNKIGITYMPNISGVNDSRYQNGTNPSDAIGLGQEQRQQRYMERKMQIFQLRGEHVIENFYNSKLTWVGSYTTGTQSTPDLRVFINSYEESDGSRVYLDASGADVTEEALALISDGEDLNEYFPGFTTEVVGEGELEYSIEDNLYPSPTRYYREMTDNTLDLKLNLEVPLKGKEGFNNKLSVGGSYVGKTREYSESRYSFISNGLEYNGDPNAYFAEENMNIVPGSTSYLYLRDDTDIQNSYTASQDVIGAFAMLDYNINKKFKVNGGVRLETTTMLLESEKLNQSDLDAEQQENFKGTLDLVDVLPAVNMTYQLRKQDLAMTNLRFSASRSVARPMFREKAPYSVFDFEIQEQQTGNTDLTRTQIDNLDLRLEHYPGLGEIYSVSLFYKNFTDPIEQVIIATAANTEITWVNVDRAQVFGAEFELRKNLSGISPSLKNFSVGANLTIVHSATDIQEDELTEIRATDNDHADTRPMYGQSPYLLNAIGSYRNDSIGLRVS